MPLFASSRANRERRGCAIARGSAAGAVWHDEWHGCDWRLADDTVAGAAEHIPAGSCADRWVGDEPATTIPSREHACAGHPQHQRRALRGSAADVARRRAPPGRAARQGCRRLTDRLRLAQCEHQLPQTGVVGVREVDLGACGRSLVTSASLIRPGRMNDSRASWPCAGRFLRLVALAGHHLLAHVRGSTRRGPAAGRSCARRSGGAPPSCGSPPR